MVLAGHVQPLDRKSADPPLLLQVDRLGTASKPIRRAGLHLDEDDFTVPGSDQVKLALPHPPVALQYLVTMPAVEPSRGIFPGPAERQPTRGQSSGWGSSSTVIPRVLVTVTLARNRDLRYMSQTQQSLNLYST